MIKFFRVIRQQLLTQRLPNSPVGKYLLYAIGEIVLVVIGILIALQLNNWNEQKKEQFKEFQVLTNLSKDFDLNLEALDQSIISYPEWANRLKTTLTYIGLSESELTAGMKDTIRNTNYITTKIVEGSLSSILGSNKLELISNDSLKNQLTSYPAIIKDFKEKELNLEHYVVDVQRNILRSHISLIGFLSFDDEYGRQIESKVIHSDYSGLINNLYYQNVLIGVYLVNQAAFVRAKILRRKTQEINTLIKREISRNPNFSNQ